MTPHVLFSLILASPPAMAPVETVRTHDLGMMTFEEAKRLDGKTVRVAFKVDCVLIMLPKIPTFVVIAKGARGVTRWVRLPRSAFSFGKLITAEGVLRTRTLPASVIDGKMLLELREIIVDGAWPVRP
jgi:hypothetical protein